MITPEGHQCELHGSSFKIGLRGMIFRHNGFEWKRSSVEREIVERRTRKDILHRVFSPLQLVDIRKTEDNPERAFIDGEISLLGFDGLVAEYPTEWTAL